jgi:hypothetical protein
VNNITSAFERESLMLTPPEILLHRNSSSKFVARERVLTCALTCKTLDGLSIAKMCSLDSDASAERFHSCAETRGFEGLHLLRKISNGIERCSADIDVHHQLTVSWPHGRVETLPCFQPTAKSPRSSCRAEEVSVLTDFDAAPQWMGSKNEI